MRRRVSLAIDDLRTIVAVAEEQNFHRAGRKVGLTQSGVTRAVARVEQYAGAIFFERSHSKRHSVSPTDAGRCFVERARLAIAHSESAVVSARETLHGIEHRIVVGKSWYTDRRLVTILRSMELPLYPGLQVVLETRLPGELAVCVRSGEFDLAVMSNPIEDQFLTAMVVRSIPFVVLLPAVHPCADKETVTLSDLASTPWVLFGRHIHPSLYDTFLRRGHDLGIAVDRICHIADAEEACEVVRLIGGAAFLSPQGAARVATDEVILRRLDEKDIILKTQVIARAENSSMLVGEFVRTFVKRLKSADLYQPLLPESMMDANFVA